MDHNNEFGTFSENWERPLHFPKSSLVLTHGLLDEDMEIYCHYFILSKLQKNGSDYYIDCQTHFISSKMDDFWSKKIDIFPFWLKLTNFDHFS